MGWWHGKNCFVLLSPSLPLGPSMAALSSGTQFTWIMCACVVVSVCVCVYGIECVCVCMVLSVCVCVFERVW